MEQEGNPGANAASRENQIRLAETRGKCDHKTTNLGVGRSNRSGCAISLKLPDIEPLQRLWCRARVDPAHSYALLHRHRACDIAAAHDIAAAGKGEA